MPSAWSASTSPLLGTLFLILQYLHYVHDRFVEATGLLLVNSAAHLGFEVAAGVLAPAALFAALALRPRRR